MVPISVATKEKNADDGLFSRTEDTYDHQANKYAYKAGQYDQKSYTGFIFNLLHFG